jgi:hypothetical protein
LRAVLGFFAAGRNLRILVPSAFRLAVKRESGARLLDAKPLLPPQR